jgi:hypothetical protein
MIPLRVFYLGFEQNQCLYLGFMNIRSGSLSTVTLTFLFYVKFILIFRNGQECKYICFL